MIKIILWDIDGTVLDFKASESASMKATYKHFGLGECTDEKVAKYSAINNVYWQRLERGEVTKPQVLIGRFREFLSLEGIASPTAEEFCKYYEGGLADTIVYIDNSLELLKELSKDYKQYAVTNGAYNVQTKKLARSGFDKVLDGVFISDEIGYEKPSKQFFDIALDKMPKASLDEILIVGDSLTSDIKGGNNAGIKTCLYNPKGNPVPEGYKVDYQIKALDEIYSVLENEK